MGLPLKNFSFFFSVKSCMNSLLPLGVVVQKMDNTIVDRVEWLWSPSDSFVIQGFWYSAARSWSREIQVNPGNSQKHAKYCKNSKMWNLSQLLGLFNCCKHANVSWNFITAMSKLCPKSTRCKLCREKLSTSHDLKS